MSQKCVGFVHILRKSHKMSPHRQEYSTNSTITVRYAMNSITGRICKLSALENSVCAQSVFETQQLLAYFEACEFHIGPYDLYKLCFSCSLTLSSSYMCLLSAVMSGDMYLVVSRSLDFFVFS